MNLPPASQVSPLNVNMFALELAHHPDQALVSEVLQGLSQGFRLGFNPGTNLRSSKKDKASAYQHPDIIDAYLSNEIRLGRVAGPFLFPPISNLHVNSFGVIPKKGQPNKWRLILDLSSPLGASVNEGINPEDYPCCITLMTTSLLVLLIPLNVNKIWLLLLQFVWHLAYLLTLQRRWVLPHAWLPLASNWIL